VFVCSCSCEGRLSVLSEVLLSLRTTTLSQSGLLTHGAASPDVAGINVHVDDVVHF